MFLTETYIAKFHGKICIQAIQNMLFHFPSVLFLVTYHVGKEKCEAFQHRGSYKFIKCHCGYEEHLVAIFYT